MSDLLMRQQVFAEMAAMLILQAVKMGYGVTLGDAYRDPRCPYGAENSLHKMRLAIDLNLFRNGKFLERTEDHEPLGEWWESKGGTWGGRFTPADGNHYSLPWRNLK